MSSLEQEIKMRKDFDKEILKAKKDTSDIFKQMNKVAKKLKLGFFGEESYQPQAPYYIGICGQTSRIALFRNDFYNSVITRG